MITLDNPLAMAHYASWLTGLVVVCYALKSRYPWTVVLAFGFTVFSALRIFQNSLNGIPTNRVIQLFDMAAESALISFLLTVLIAQALPVQKWIKVFKAIAAVNAVLILAHFLFLACSGVYHRLPLSQLFNQEPWGLLMNASMSGCLNAAIFPLLGSKEKTLLGKEQILRGLVLLSILAAGRSLPLAVLFAGIGGFLLVQKRYRDLAIAVVSSFMIGFLIKGTHLFTLRGRDWIWAQGYYYFRDHIHWAIGSGLGGFYIIGPVLSNPEQPTVFTWLHSDWLQTLFEQGFIGFAPVVAVYGQALMRAKKEPRLFAALTAYGTFAIANMPLRYPISGLLGAVLIRWALEFPTNTRPQNTRIPKWGVILSH